MILICIKVGDTNNPNTPHGQSETKVDTRCVISLKAKAILENEILRKELGWDGWTRDNQIKSNCFNT